MTSFYHLPAGVEPGWKSPPRAQIVSWADQQKSNAKGILQAPSIARCAIAHHHANDYGLARLDSTAQKAGVGLIAILGSFCSKQHGAWVPLALGAASWLGAMALTPVIINALVYLKTGLNLNTHYLSPNGEVHPLYQDPNYQPNVLPQETKVKLAQRFGIPLDHPNVYSLLQAKVKQIGVQANTWWMLMAGFATPVIASALCDQLEDPVKGFAARLHKLKIAYWELKPALGKPSKPKRLNKALTRTINTVVGKNTEFTSLSFWWKGLGNGVIQTLQLDRLPQDVLKNVDSEAGFQATLEHLQERLGTPEGRTAFETELKHQRQKLAGILECPRKLLSPKINGRPNPIVERLLKTPQGQETYAQLKQTVTLQGGAAEATLTHLEQLLQSPGKSLSWLRNRMTNAGFSFINHIRPEVDQAIELAGGAKKYQQIFNMFDVEGNAKAAEAMMGAAPRNFLIERLKSLGTQRHWRKWFPGLMGAAMLLSTAFYVAVFIGADRKNSTSKPFERKA